MPTFQANDQEEGLRRLAEAGRIVRSAVRLGLTPKTVVTTLALYIDQGIDDLAEDAREELREAVRAS